MLRRKLSANIWTTSMLLGGILFATGCGGSATSPATPADSPAPPPEALVSASLPEGSGLLALAEVTVNLEDLSYEMHPLRNANLTFGENFPGVNLTGYLGSNPCSTCLRLEMIELDPIKDLLSITFAIRHPFPEFPDFPRQDLDAFDVRGVVLLPEPVVGAYQFTTEVAPGVAARGDVFSMVNADGYTSDARSLWTDPTFLNPANPSELSTLNPFKFYQSNGLERRFSQGQGFEGRKYTFDVSRTFGAVRLLLAITANYGTPIRSIADRPAPQYFVPWFNQKEAYRAEVQHVAAAQPMDWKNASSQTVLEIFISDHQRNLPAKNADIEWDDPANTIAFPSNVQNMTVEIPRISNTTFTSPLLASGTGTFADPYRYTMTVTNNKGATFGASPMLLKVVDEYQGRAAYAIGGFRIPYIDNFDREDTFAVTGWTAGKPLPGTGPGWGVATAGGEGNYLDDNAGNPYENNVGLTLNLPEIDLTWSSALPVLEVRHRYDLEPLLDGGAVFLSLDGGFTFNYNAPIPVLTGQDYTHDMLPKTAPFDVLAYKRAFSGNSEGNAVTQFDLSAAAGEPDVVVQFVFSSNASGGGSTPPFYQGWSIYEVKLFP